VKKRYLMITALLTLGTMALSAQTFYTVGVGVGYTGQAVSSSGTLDLVSANIDITVFTGRNLGLYTQMFFGTNLSATYQGTSQMLPSDGMNYDTDLLFGLGYLVPIGRTMMLIAGGGVYFGAIFVQSTSYYSSAIEDLAITVGPGVGVTYAFRLGGNFFLSTNVMVAYGLFDPMELSTSVSGNGFRVLGGAGIGIAL